MRDPLDRRVGVTKREAANTGYRPSRDLLRLVFLTRSEGVQMEAGELSEAEVELEVVEPWDTRVNMFGA